MTEQDDVLLDDETTVPATPLEPADPIDGGAGGDEPPTDDTDLPGDPEPPSPPDIRRFAIVGDGVVVNVTEADLPYGLAQGWIETDTAGIGWLYVDGELTAPGAAAPTRDELVAAVTAHRWAVETGGIILPTGAVVHTTIDDQNRITSVIANAQAAGVESVDFKAASGWVTLTIPELQQVAAAIALHVQAAFSAERAHHEAIEAWPEDDLADYDITTGWPPNAPQPSDETPTDPGHEPGSSHLES